VPRFSQEFSGHALLAVTLLASLLVGFVSGCARTATTDEAEPQVAPQQDSTRASTLTSGEVQKRAHEPIEATLARRFPGVQVTRSADGTLRFRIRGKASFYGSTEPLILIDGNPLAAGHGGRLAGINPYYIESIEVLTHPPGTTLYGVRGANGVILIKTKQPDR
jgi:TonB-dependent SusC/RagA subfamily outer membrane receptor